MKKSFNILLRILASLYTKWNLFWQLLAFLLTYILSTSGFDWFYFEATRGKILQSFLWPAVLIGFFLPVLLPIIIYIVGKFNKNIITIYISYTLATAGVLGFAISTLYKVFTGRPGPYGLGEIGVLTDISQIFKFGIYRGGAFQGWPSSHTTVAFAMSFALVALFPKNKALKWVAIIYAFYIGIGVSTNIHWFSDFVAGAIIGTIIGIAVGKNFFNYLKIKNKI